MVPAARSVVGRIAATVYRLRSAVFVVALAMPVRVQRERSMARVGDPDGDRQAGPGHADGRAAGEEDLSESGGRHGAVARDHRFDSRAGVPGVLAEVITNGVDPTRFGPAMADAESQALLGSEPGPIFIFAGLLGLAQGLDQILDLAAALPADVPGRFVLVGEGPARENLQARVEREKIARVKIVPPQKRERVPALLASADAAVISLGMAIPGAVPSKIYEAMASSLPILLIAEGEAARRVEEAGCGLAVAPGDSAGLAAVFRRLSSDVELRRQFGAAGHRAAETTYNRDQIAQRLDDFFRKLLPSARRFATGNEPKELNVGATSN